MDAKKVLHNRYFYLLCSLLLFFILRSFFLDHQLDLVIFGFLFAVILVASVYIIKHRKNLLVAAICFAIVVLGGHVAAIVFNLNKELLLLDNVVTALFFIFITISVLSYVIQDEVISVSTLYGAICGYLLIGFTWGFFYSIIHILQPNAFSFQQAVSHADELRLEHFSYYSYVTLTTLGYGDITPLSHLAKTFSWLEAATGQVYLTVWIAQLVGLHIAQRKTKS